MAKPLVYNATLAAREDFTPALSVFTVRPDEPVGGGARPAFVPGQYVVLGLNNEEKPELGSVRRPMSIASAPEQEGAVELYIRYVSHPESDNPLTHLLWKIGAGARIFLGPKVTGTFTLEHTVGSGDDRLKVCVAAGTGLAPFLSMVRSDLSRGVSDLSRYVVLHGASYPADLGYREELEGLRRDHGLHYLASVSRPKEAPEWGGDSGRVEDYFLPERLAELERRLGLGPGSFTPEAAAVFICGLQGTIGHTILRLVPRGFVPENKRIRRALEGPEDVPSSLFFEQYDSTPVIDLKDEALVARLKGELGTVLAAG